MFLRKDKGYCFIFLIIASKAIVYIISSIFILADPNGFARDIKIRIYCKGLKKTYLLINENT